MIPAGAKQYILMTNVPGTAHPGTGSIDSVHSLLEKELPIPATCLWRNDLSRRLDTAWDLKWAYPELMTGLDLIRFILEKGLSEDNERRASAIRAFVTSQHSLDREVKFKQVELQNKLLDLFIDVPIEPASRISVANKGDLFRPKRFYYSYKEPDDWVTSEGFAYVHEDLFTESSRERFFLAHHGSRRSVGSATFVLTSQFQEFTQRIVIEGAPGQGKSTVTQYVCQVHRMKLLELTEDMQSVSQSHKDAPVRLPLRVDLRDFASWLGRENPFTTEGGEVFSAGWNRSLESFLAALIHYQSGGVRFEVSDLHAVARLSSLLIVFDGLDEVADVKKRQDVVDEITKGIERLQSNAASLQVVVTSRPAAFANSPGFSEETFRYFDLAAVTPELIDEYATKWLRARQLQEREAAEVRRILKEKLEHPHLRDLARNPMQLAILLSLIHTRGTSLPDKRTALYDSYIELFFNREAEKSPVVRDNRDLLINIHRYLAWLLHSEAELGSEHEVGRRNGAISSERLIKTLKEYLLHEGHNPELAEVLFRGMVERVVALVSRVEGTYEFEVQPLREYFAARFLYETAPYSPPGAEKAGTKPDRFDAIARDFYWLNVTRFYAGCYSKGELASLIDRLKELTKDKEFRLLSHPRVLGSILLSDWVFSQHPRSVQEVVALVLDGVGLRYVLASNSRRTGTTSTMILPKSCGRSELISRCESILRKSPPLDYALDIIDLLKANATTDELLALWLADNRRKDSRERISWLQQGLHLGCLSVVNQAELKGICEERPMRPEVLDALFRARRTEIFEHSIEDFNVAADGILALHARANNARPERILELLLQSVNAMRYGIAFAAPQASSLGSTWSSDGPPGISELQMPSVIPAFNSAAKCTEFIETAIQESKKPAADWATQLRPWELLVEKGRALWGDRWAFYHIANLASGIKSPSETCADFSNLFNQTDPLCRRARYARLRAGVAQWWPKQLAKAANKGQQAFVIMLWSSWGSPATLHHKCADFDLAIGGLPQDEWNCLYDCVAEIVGWTRSQSGARKLRFELDKLPKSLSPRTATLFALRANSESVQELYIKYLLSYKGDDLRVLSATENMALTLLGKDADWKRALALISRAFQQGVVSERYAYHTFIRNRQRVKIPLDEAAKIMRRADKYPSYVVASAEARCKENAAKKLIPVAKIAEQDRWFSE
jgi:hypothetical protein